MEDRERLKALEKKLDEIKEDLSRYEETIMRNNVTLGDMCYARYGDRLGFEKDGSRTKDGVVVWPERMVVPDAT